MIENDSDMFLILRFYIVQIWKPPTVNAWMLHIVVLQHRGMCYIYM